MNAGLPGTGLGGIFYLVLALFMPLVELGRTARGRSSAERWRRVGAQFAIALGILAATLAVAYGATRSWGRLVGFSPVLVSATVLVVLLALIRVWARLGAVGSAPGRHRLG